MTYPRLLMTCSPRLVLWRSLGVSPRPAARLTCEFRGGVARSRQAEEVDPTGASRLRCPLGRAYLHSRSPCSVTRRPSGHADTVQPFAFPQLVVEPPTLNGSSPG